MRTNVFLALALASVAAPALAYPSTTAPVTKRSDLSDVTARDVVSLLARNDVYARSFGSDFVQGFEKGFTGTLKTVGPLVLGLLKREDEIDLLARQALSEYMQRRDDLDERSFGSDFVDGFKKGFVGTIKTLGPLVLSVVKREDLEVVARDALLEHMERRSDLDERSFGSDFVDGFKKGFVGTLKTVGPLVLGLLKREDTDILARSEEELLARSFGSDFVDGFKKGFVGTIKTLGPLALGLLKREEAELLARYYPEVATRSLEDLD
ncbi:hypothetical protein PsYK624_091460 [Phanerochaete sordida]|uniref:Uncharacterized protein n=1 Tax=Phanerochaete sordida TaxID=48140 RepID=A0A9P3GDY8_9APHY|nr:hypothetical protein PsYK624_091460 [Phanerochaete sordida]